ncbi:hypothetical protein G7046_g6577 [Stylonectria norvegica]|nr:hypothetical protein G7046_g6577 [Stylonectria norvegica]
MEDGSLASEGLQIMHLFNRLQSLEETTAQEKTRQSSLDSTSSTHLPLDLFIAEADRFQLWAENLGLFVIGHGSLDYRLRQTESIKSTLQRFLESLKASLEGVVEYDGPLEDSEDDEVEDSGSSAEDEKELQEFESDADLLLDSVRDPIDRLYKLSMWIRNPSFRSRSSKAQRHREIDPDTNIDLLEAFEAYDLDYVRSIFKQYRRPKKPELKKPVPTSSNVSRRRQFAYWSKHREKLREHAKSVLESMEQPKKSIDNHHQCIPETTDIKLPPVSPGCVQSITTATLLSPSRQMPQDGMSVVFISEYSPSAWQSDAAIFEFPPPPKTAIDAKFFECPYCFTMCRRATLADKAWKAHLIHDLRPYVCVYEDCQTPEQLYDSRQDWIEHLDDSHTAQHGLCCPICSQLLQTQKSLQAHIALHLDRFSIFSFPRAVGGQEDDAEGGSNESKKAAADSRATEYGKEANPHQTDCLREESQTRETGEAGTKSKDTPLNSSDAIEEVEKMQVKMLKSKETLGLEHSETLKQMAELVSRLRDVRGSQSAEVLQMCREGLEAATKVFGEEDAKTIEFMHALGYQLMFHGTELDEPAAEILLRRSWLPDKESCGRRLLKEPDYMLALGELYSRQARHGLAEEFYRQSVQIWRKAHGEESAIQSEATYRLGRTLNNQKKYVEGEKVLRGNLILRQRTLNMGHPETISSASELARALRSQGHYEDAEMMLRESLEHQKRDDFESAVVMLGVAVGLQKQGRYKEGEILLREALELTRALADGPDRVPEGSRRQTAEVVNSILRGKSEIIPREGTGSDREADGEMKPQTIVMLLDLGSAMAAQGKDKEAEGVLRKAVELNRHIVGREQKVHQAVIDKVLINLGIVFQRQHKFNASEHYFRGVVDFETAQGQDDTALIYPRRCLGLALYQIGKLDEATQLLRASLETSVSVLGEGHEATAMLRGDLSIVDGSLFLVYRAAELQALEHHRHVNEDEDRGHVRPESMLASCRHADGAHLLRDASGPRRALPGGPAAEDQLWRGGRQDIVVLEDALGLSSGSLPVLGDAAVIFGDGVWNRSGRSGKHKANRSCGALPREIVGLSYFFPAKWGEIGAPAGDNGESHACRSTRASFVSVRPDRQQIVTSSIDSFQRLLVTASPTLVEKQGLW